MDVPAGRLSEFPMISEPYSGGGDDAQPAVAPVMAARMRIWAQGELLQAGTRTSRRGEGVLANDPGTDQRGDPESRHEREPNPHTGRGRVRGAGPDEPAADGILEVVQRPDQGRPHDATMCRAMDFDELFLAESLTEKKHASMEGRVEAHVIRIARAPDTVEMKVRVVP